MTLEEFSQRFVGHMLRHPDFELLHAGRSFANMLRTLRRHIGKNFIPTGFLPRNARIAI
jgi:hypothetical protein